MAPPNFWGEEYVKSLCSRYFIVRTAWLYWVCRKELCEDHPQCGEKKFGAVEVVNDQLGNPTNAEDLAYHLLKLCVTREYGIYHCTGEGVCSWYDFTCEILRLAGVDAKVTPRTSAE